MFRCQRSIESITRLLLPNGRPRGRASLAPRGERERHVRGARCQCDRVVGQPVPLLAYALVPADTVSVAAALSST